MSQNGNPEPKISDWSLEQAQAAPVGRRMSMVRALDVPGKRVVVDGEKHADMAAG